MSRDFLKKSLEPMPHPAPENYLTYFVDFEPLYREYCRWARLHNFWIQNKGDFCKELLLLFPGVGWVEREHGTQLINVRRKY